MNHDVKIALNNSSQNKFLERKLGFGEGISVFDSGKFERKHGSLIFVLSTLLKQREVDN